MSKTTETDTFKRLKAFMKDVDGDQCRIILNAPVKEISFLGGLLHGYRREPLAA